MFVESRSFKYGGEKNEHMLHYELVFGNVSERRESECCGVLSNIVAKLEVNK